MKFSDRFGVGFLESVMITIVMIMLISHTAYCSKKDPLSAVKSFNKQQPASSEEEEGEDETPESRLVKGMAFSGISYLKSTETAPKCLGQDMRLEKMIQVTEHCEMETGEGKNSTEANNKSLSLCFTACMWKYLRLIGDDLMFTSEMDSMVIDLFPPVAHAMVMKAVRGCAKVSVLPLSKADNCASFGPVKGCILKAVQNICSGNY